MDTKILAQIAEAAVKASRLTGCSAEVIATQCIFESGSLAHAPGNNCFGIKAYAGQHGEQLLHTTEWFTDSEKEQFVSTRQGRTAVLKHPDVSPRKDGRREYAVQDWFAVFETLAACFVKRSAMWDVGRYKPSADAYRTSGDLKAYVYAMASIYATDPDYAKDIWGMCQNAALVAAIAAARQETVA